MGGCASVKHVHTHTHHYTSAETNSVTADQYTSGSFGIVPAVPPSSIIKGSDANNKSIPVPTAHEQYFNKHGVPQAIEDALKLLATTQPGNPYDFLASYFAKKRDEAPNSKWRVASNAGPPTAKLEKSSCFTLSSGHPMPMVGYGTFRSEPGEVGPALVEAIKAGYRHLDFAHVYGNEGEVGAALKQAFDANLVKREDLFLTGKLWNTDHDVEVVPKAYAKSCQDLGVTYLDLYLIHFPVSMFHTGLDKPGCEKVKLGNTALIDTWRAMEKLVDDGKVRSIGVSNFPLMLLHDLVNMARIRPAVNQIEVHAHYVRDSLVNYCLSRKIAVTAHTPLGGGAANATSWQSVNLLEQPVIKEIAEAIGKQPGQVLLRWLLQRNIQVIPKSVKAARMASNIDLFDFELSQDHMARISALDQYRSSKTNPNPLSHFIGGPDCFSKDGTDIFD